MEAAGDAPRTGPCSPVPLGHCWGWELAVCRGKLGYLLPGLHVTLQTSTSSMYIILYTRVKCTRDLRQRRLARARSWVRAPAALPRRTLPAHPVAVRWYIPKPHAHAEAGQAAGHQLMLRPPAITHFSTTAQQPQHLLRALGSCLDFQIHVSCSISKTKHQSSLTPLVFKTSFDICMWGCIFPGGCTKKLR